MAQEGSTAWGSYIPGADFEHNDRWTAVDAYAKQHVTPQDSPFHAAINYASQVAAEHKLPGIEVPALQGKFLALQCKLVRARNALEVGTLGGYSGVWIASSSPDIRLTTLELKAQYKAVADEVFAKAGIADRVQSLLGDARDILPQLRAEVEAGKRDKFQFVFIDANKDGNLAYLNEAVQMCDSGACIIVDNVVRQGSVVDEEAAKTDLRIAGSRSVIEGAAKHPRLDCTVIQTVSEKSYDGFLMCVVK